MLLRMKMKEILLTNTFSGKLEKFESLAAGKAGLYVCGLTPYDSTHLGHARCYVTFDVVRRTLEAAGYEVRHVQNFTDMDDKILQRAKEKGVEPLALAETFIAEYFEVMDALGVRRAHEYPRVTQHIAQIIEAVGALIKNGFAYPALSGDVFFSVGRFKNYGRLSGRKTEQLQAGARVEVSPHKKDPLDFALWKFTPKDAVQWDSPWGRGRPGWHIECSVMSYQALGQPFDIHGGGQDLIFPHHENEIAQSEAWHATAFSRYFLHNGFVTVNKEKMSKSLGNFFALKDVLAHYEPRVVRYYLLTEHYRSPLDFSDEALKEAGQALGRLDEAMSLLSFYLRVDSVAPKAGPLSEKASQALFRDFHTPGALAGLQQWAAGIFEAFKARRLGAEVAAAQWADASWALQELLGIPQPLPVPVPAQAEALAQEREERRRSKDFAQADQMRRRLLEEFGLVIEDTPYGPRLKTSAVRQ